MPAVVRASHGDAEAIVELCNAHARELYGEAVVDRDEVMRWFALPNLHLWVARDPGGELAAYADVHEEDERRRYWLDLREHPARRSQGAAAALLDAVETWARSRAADGALLRGAAESRDGRLLALYEAKGYRLVRHSLEMRISLEEDLAEPRWPESIRVREFVPGQDERAVYDADMEAFEDHWEFVRQPFDEWRAWAVDQPRFDPSLWFLALDGAELAGCCLAGVHASGDPSFGYISTLAVRRRWRRRGLGLALLQHAFRELRRRGMTRAGLDVDAENLTGAVRVYERAGMHVHKRRDTYEKAL